MKNLMGKRRAIKTVRLPELPVEAACATTPMTRLASKHQEKQEIGILQEVLSSQTTSLAGENYRDMDNQA